MMFFPSEELALLINFCLRNVLALTMMFAGGLLFLKRHIPREILSIALTGHGVIACTIFSYWGVTEPEMLIQLPASMLFAAYSLTHGKDILFSSLPKPLKRT